MPEDGLREGLIPGFLPLADNEMEDVVRQLDHEISRLEGVLHLKKMITAAGGKIFSTNGKKASFETTLNICKEAGGSIATPRSRAENDAILYFVKSFNTYAYLGIKESLIPSTFQFLDGTKLNYTNWHLNEPSGKGEEECVEMYTDGTWNDKKCNQNRLIVCQF
uniref:C-type lectin domain-containing protein n=2 Tax=Strigops habroptila TaxID=2489341 RepID=A0A672U7A0_STRHB